MFIYLILKGNISRNLQERAWQLLTVWKKGFRIQNITTQCRIQTCNHLITGVTPRLIDLTNHFEKVCNLVNNDKMDSKFLRALFNLKNQFARKFSKFSYRAIGTKGVTGSHTPSIFSAMQLNGKISTFVTLSMGNYQLNHIMFQKTSCPSNCLPPLCRIRARTFIYCKIQAILCANPSSTHIDLISNKTKVRPFFQGAPLLQSLVFILLL